MFPCETYDELYKIYNDTSKYDVTMTTFVRLKPFYIGPVTNQGMESCKCINCLNPHNIYDAIKNKLRKLPSSLTEYLCHDMVCDKSKEINMHHLECIEGKRKNSCKITNLENDLCEEIRKTKNKTVSYYIFAVKKTSFFKSSGEKSFYTRTTRIDLEGTLKDVIDELEKRKEEYLKHRFSTTNEEYYWRYFQSNTQFFTIWLDYSMNIELTEKKQAQSGHYSGSQQSCHCIIIKHGTEFVKYVYHLSEDTIHDSVMTFEIIRDIIQRYPYVLNDGYLILHSDNASSQYKCKFTFFETIELAKEHGITVCWFYGEPGHGKGTIDAMSAFGCKTR